MPSPKKRAASKSRSPSKSTERSRSRSRKTVKRVSQTPPAPTPKKRQTRASRSQTREVAAPVTASPVKRTRTPSKTREPIKKAATEPPKKAATEPVRRRRSSARIAEIEVHKELKQVEVRVQNVISTPGAPTATCPIPGCATVKCAVACVLCVIVTVAIVTLPFKLQVTCTKDSCNFFKYFKFPKTLDAYFDRDAYLAVFSTYIVFALVNALPIGRTITGPTTGNGKRLQYRLNGIFAIFIGVAAYGAALHFKCPQVPAMASKRLQMITALTKLASIIAVVIFYRGRNCPKNAMTPMANGNIFHDFFTGREQNPRLGPLDAKLVVTRFGAFMIILMDLQLVVLPWYTSRQMPNTALLLSFVCQAIAVIGIFLAEEVLLSQWEFEVPGCGWACIWFNICFKPVMFTLPVFYLSMYPQTWHNWQLGLMGVGFVAGFLLLILSMMQKAKFSRNPYDPSMTHLESVSLSGNKRALVGGWWRFCQKPNFLGFILMVSFWTLPCGFTHFWPWVTPLVCTAMMLRMERAESQYFASKYVAWGKYTAAVPSRIIPYVY